MLNPWNLLLLILPFHWLLCAWYYKRIYGRGLHWWAMPFSVGALLFGWRLPQLERNR